MSNLLILGGTSQFFTLFPLVPSPPGGDKISGFFLSCLRISHNLRAISVKSNKIIYLFWQQLWLGPKPIDLPLREGWKGGFSPLEVQQLDMYTV